MKRQLRFAALIVWAGFAHAAAQAQVAFDCRSDDSRCPEVVIAGDPAFALPGFGPAPFRGYADPSLRHDPKTGALWLSYSWLSMQVAPTSVPGKPVLDSGVSIHFARSDDGGRTFRHVRDIWTSDPETYKNGPGYSDHEVSTISPAGAGWAALDLRYFNPRGNGNDFKPDSFHFEFVEGPDPEQLASASAARLGGPLTAGDWRPFGNLSQTAGVGLACPIWTEPSLFEDAGELYLLAQCKTPSNPAKGVLGLFVRQGADWRWVGRLTSPDDAKALGGNELTQADLARARDGSLLLIVTPNIVKGRDEHHLGCSVLSVVSLDPPALKRDPAGAPVERARIVSSDSAANGPGACAYDPASATGLLIVRRVVTPGKGIVFSLHATGVHP